MTTITKKIPRRRGLLTTGLAALALLSSVQQAQATNSLNSSFNSTYLGSATGANAACAVCHLATDDDAGGLNEYGYQLQQNSQSFSAIENLTSANVVGTTTMLEEINAGTQPGWTTDNNNNIYDLNGNLLDSNASAPGGIVGSLDPAAGNNAPVANDDTYATPFQTQLTVAAPGVLGNDTDADGDTLTAQLVSGPTAGTLDPFSNDGSFVYVPALGFSGAATFTYVANDNTVDSNVATVTINVGTPDPDQDADGIADNLDNCINVPNGPLIPDAGGNSQRDTDNDGYGNVCDPDFDQNDVVDLTDFASFRAAFDQTGDIDEDLNGDDIVDTLDFSIFRLMFDGPPGPSGLAQ